MNHQMSNSLTVSGRMTEFLHLLADSAKIYWVPIFGRAVLGAGETAASYTLKLHAITLLPFSRGSPVIYATIIYWIIHSPPPPTWNVTLVIYYVSVCFSVCFWAFTIHTVDLPVSHVPVLHCSNYCVSLSKVYIYQWSLLMTPILFRNFLSILVCFSMWIWESAYLVKQLPAGIFIGGNTKFTD